MIAKSMKLKESSVLELSCCLNQPLVIFIYFGLQIEHLEKWQQLSLYYIYIKKMLSVKCYTKNVISTKFLSINDPFCWIKCICRVLCQIYKAKLINKLTPSWKKTKFFSYCIIFLLSSRVSDLRPWSQNNVILTNKITALEVSLLIQLPCWYVSLSNIEKLILPNQKK